MIDQSNETVGMKPIAVSRGGSATRGAAPQVGADQTGDSPTHQRRRARVGRGVAIGDSAVAWPLPEFLLQASRATNGDEFSAGRRHHQRD